MSASAVAPAEGPVVLSADAVRHRYGPRTGLEEVSFRVSSPGVVAVKGANGAGKSTLLRILVGLLRPSQGHTALQVEGGEIPLAGRARWMGYAGPDLAFYLEFSAGENLCFAAETRGMARPAEAARAALARVGLESRARDRVGALSSGMVQRLRLAFALLHEPPVLLLDEPGSHLDEEGKTMLATLVARERARRLVVIATNEEREWSLADRWIELRGRGLGDPP